MSDLLLELFSEEIPARMQAQASADLKKLVTDALVERGLTYEAATSFATPRRLALNIVGLPTRQPDQREEKKGPRVGAPEAAVQGFLKSAGLATLDAAKIEADKKGGQFYLAVIERKGAATLDVLAEILPNIIKTFPWPKAMRWGVPSAESSALRWVRPLHSIVATFGPETEDPEIVPFEVGGVSAGNVTYGHRFMAPQPIKVRRFDDYLPALEKAKVVLDPARRRDIILHDCKDLAFAQGLELVEDESLLNEVAGLVEWPVVLMGEFDASFLEIPGEVIRATIRANQKCFVLRNPETRALANKFLLVSNIVASDGGKAIAAGNGRVVRARLSDALYFWKTDQGPLPDYADQGKPLDQRLAKLRALKIVFHQKLGTQGERVDRIIALARELAAKVGADPDQASRAAELAKADLVTEVVGEFPETQGLMGRRYAELQGEDAEVAAAIEDHYKPQGPNDRIPNAPVSIAVALADKLDTLVGFWAIGEKPTGSKDPFALRRAALGVIRLLLDNEIRLPLTDLLSEIYGWRLQKYGAIYEYLFNNWGENRSTRVLEHHPIQRAYFERDPTFVAWFDEFVNFVAENWEYMDEELKAGASQSIPTLAKIFDNERERELIEFRSNDGDLPSDDPDSAVANLKRVLNQIIALAEFSRNYTEFEFKSGQFRTICEQGKNTELRIAEPTRRVKELSQDLFTFFADRLKIDLRDRGARHDLLDAVFALGGDDLVMIVKRVEALAKFLATEDGATLLAGYKRATNILKAEEKKDGAGAFEKHPEANLRIEPQEHALAAALDRAEREAQEKLRSEDFDGALHALAKLRAPVDAFFDHVTVNADNADLRKNRLQLLAQLRRAMHLVADFSKVGGA